MEEAWSRRGEESKGACKSIVERTAHVSSCQQSPSASELIEPGKSAVRPAGVAIRQEREKAEGKWTIGGGDEDRKCNAGLPANTVMQAVQRGRARGWAIGDWTELRKT